jgi:hypothetical protein
VQGHEVAAFDFGTTFPDGHELGFGWRLHGIAALKILAPRLAQELRARAVFLPLNFFHLLNTILSCRTGKDIFRHLTHFVGGKKTGDSRAEFEILFKCSLTAANSPPHLPNVEAKFGFDLMRSSARAR